MSGLTVLPMTFYLKPPRGSIALHNLRACVEERIKLFMCLDQPGHGKGSGINFGLLRDGTALDRTAHYILRLLCVVSPEIAPFVLEKEKKLFVVRLNECTQVEFVKIMKVVQRHVEERLLVLGSSNEDEVFVFLHTLLRVCKHLTASHIVSHIFHHTHHQHCSSWCLKVPFSTCLPLVRRRKVDLQGGLALVPCGKLQDLLVSLFEKHYLLGLQGLGPTEDPRVSSLLVDAERFLRGAGTGGPASRGQLCASDVDAQSALFPPCMSHLHATLRATHRLPHDARRHYTLFLKAVGMPVHQALVFWRQEYQLPHAGAAGCAHSWHADGRRYRYSVRHMYGLEGGRYSYSAPSCATIQKAMLTPLSEEGCPFSHFANDKLLKCLNNDIVKGAAPIMDTIFRLKKENKPSQACAKYLSACISGFKSTAHKDSYPVHNLYIQKPENFYVFLKENTSVPKSKS